MPAEEPAVNPVRRLVPGLSAMRVRACMTQAELGERVGKSGSAIARYEAGSRLPDVGEPEAFAAELGCRVEDLYERPTTKEPRPGAAWRDTDRAVPTEAATTLFRSTVPTKKAGGRAKG